MRLPLHCTRLNLRLDSDALDWIHDNDPVQWKGSTLLKAIQELKFGHLKRWH